ncbi:MAG: UvrD-helicase domain-containing protein, partial [Byssovorax sp.]
MAEVLFEMRSPAPGPDDAVLTGTPPTTEADATIFAFRRNVVVAASAGTGKTHRLTALYLLLALGLTSMGQTDDTTPAPPVSPDRLVATTFSRAAALEVSLRIERALGDLAAWDGGMPPAFDAVIRARSAALGRPLVIGEIRRRAA